MALFHLDQASPFWLPAAAVSVATQADPCWLQAQLLGVGDFIGQPGAARHDRKTS